MEDVKKKFCESCDSKGVVHKKVCPKSKAKSSKPIDDRFVEQEIKALDLEKLEREVSSEHSEAIKLNDLASKVDKLTDIVSILADKVMRKVDVPAVSVNVQMPNPEEGLPKLNPTFAIPNEWREVVDRILGKEFGATVSASNENYIITVVLPQELDRRVGEKQGRDISTGIVRRASPLADVEYWCKKIAENLSKIHPNFKK